MNKSLNLLVKNKNFSSTNIGKCLFTINHSKNFQRQKVLTKENIFENVLKVEYAVRGPIVVRAGELESELKKGTKLPFDRVIRANIGDCHATGQKPITFLRQIMSICSYPELLDDPRFPEDVKQRARRILGDCKGGSVGSYTDSAGLDVIKQDIANFITKRDNGVKANSNDIFLTAGASDGIKTIMELLLIKSDKPAGFMIPIPQYPLYSATISEFDAHQIGYYLDEDNKWSLNINELQRSYDEAKSKCVPRALCIINPGNPTGNLLTRKNMEEIVKWAHENKLFVLADEVYQDNVYAEGMEWHSFKKVAYELGEPYRGMEIASFYSTSKGYMGECGARGGFMEIVNMDEFVKQQLNKLVSVRLCSAALGQACVAGVVNPPNPGEPSYELFMKEKKNVLDGLKIKADLVTKLFNSIEGVKCNPVQGAMYAFPQIQIPERAIKHAQKIGMKPDGFYCFQLLEKTGICVVPGSGFHQRPGTFHFRTTILPPVDEIKMLLSKFEQFHLEFLSEWA